MDGTLVDSRLSITACMDAAFSDCGLPAPGWARTRRIIGLSLQDGLDALAPHADAPLRRRIVDRYRELYLAARQRGDDLSPAYPGADALLRDLLSAGWLLGIATGKSRRGLDAVLEQRGWRTLFATAWCADDGPGKPSPFMVMENMRATGAHPRATIVIGDSEHDMAMARAAGVTGQGVDWGFGLPVEMRLAGAGHVAASMDDLAAALAGFAGDLRGAVGSGA